MKNKKLNNVEENRFKCYFWQFLVLIIYDLYSLLYLFSLVNLQLKILDALPVQFQTYELECLNKSIQIEINLSENKGKSNNIFRYFDICFFEIPKYQLFYWVGNKVISFFFYDIQTEKSEMTLLPTQYIRLFQILTFAQFGKLCEQQPRSPLSIPFRFIQYHINARRNWEWKAIRNHVYYYNTINQFRTSRAYWYTLVVLYLLISCAIAIYIHKCTLQRIEWR